MPSIARMTLTIKNILQLSWEAAVVLQGAPAHNLGTVVPEERVRELVLENFPGIPALLVIPCVTLSQPLPILGLSLPPSLQNWTSTGSSIPSSSSSSPV